MSNTGVPKVAPNTVLHAYRWTHNNPAGCFGKRSGMTHEASAQIALNPWRTLFFLADYRLIAMTSDDRKDLPTKEVPTVITHAILFRSEFRW